VVYRNGAVLGTSTDKYYPSNLVLTNNYIGKSNWAVDGPFVGRMDSFRIHGRALSASEISALYTVRLA
jgi:hypothetical protein